MTNRRKSLLLLLLFLAVILTLTQLQPWIVERSGGVAGSFGVRPMSHTCLGIQMVNNFLPVGETDFIFLRFHFRYSVTDDLSRPLCIGQDVWYGE